MIPSRIRHYVLLFVVSLFAFTKPLHADVNLVFGTYAADKPTTTIKKYKPFLDYLAARMTEILDQPVIIRMKISKEYEESIADLAQGTVDFSRFGPASYVTVKDLNPDIQIVAMELKKGKSVLTELSPSMPIASSPTWPTCKGSRSPSVMSFRPLADTLPRAI